MRNIPVHGPLVVDFFYIDETGPFETVGTFAPDGKTLSKLDARQHDGLTPELVKVIGTDSLIV